MTKKKYRLKGSETLQSVGNEDCKDGSGKSLERMKKPKRKKAQRGDAPLNQKTGLSIVSNLTLWKG